MKRDLDLLRDILLQVEAQPAGRHIDSTQMEPRGHDSATLAEHCLLLIDAGFIIGEDTSTSSARHRVSVARMTAAGHDYLAAVKGNPTWSAVKSRMAREGLNLTLDLVKALASSYARQSLGLDNM